MSVKRPPRRYVGLRVAPSGASRREVGAALDLRWRAHGGKGTAPKLLVCQGGFAIVLVPRGEDREARAALSGSAAGITFEPVVTSGTIASVKARLGVRTARP